MAEQGNAVRATWNCKWSQPGARLSRAPEHQQLGDLWVCVRMTGVRRAVSDDECARCPFWEPNYTRAN